MVELKSISLNNFSEFADSSQKFLEDFCNKKNVIKDILLDLPKNKNLFHMCEHYDILDKIVLFSDEESDLRLRLHIFADDYFDRPHNHRWSYTSRILSGGYIHRIFSVEKSVKNPEISDLNIHMIRTELPGYTYSLENSLYHSVTAFPNTVSVILRGPAELDCFRVIDREKNKAWYQYGRSAENANERKQKQMSLDRYKYIMNKLKEFGII
jgi:hypothetical protein